MSNVQRAYPRSSLIDDRASTRAMRNMEATAANSAVAAEALQGIAANTAATAATSQEIASNTARMLVEQAQSNTLLSLQAKQNDIQIQLAATANDELRAIDAAVSAAATAAASHAAEQAGLMRESIDVQRQLLQTIKSEHSRVEQDRLVKRAIYAIEKGIARIDSVTDLSVRAYAARMIRLQIDPRRFSTDDVFEISDKRLLDVHRAKLNELADNVGPAVAAELDEFERRRQERDAARVANPREAVPPAQRRQPLFQQNDERVEPVVFAVGSRVMNVSLASSLREALDKLDAKRSSVKMYRLIVAGSSAVIALLCVWVAVSSPVAGIVGLLLALAACAALVLWPVAVRFVSSIIELDLDDSVERAFLTDVGVDEAGATDALRKWDAAIRELPDRQLNLERAKEQVKRQNAAIQRNNQSITRFNAARETMLRELDRAIAERIANTQIALDEWLTAHPTMRDWFNPEAG